jgi:hypothetical protein
MSDAPPTKKGRHSGAGDADSGPAVTSPAIAGVSPANFVIVKPAPPAPLAQNLDPASAQWQSLNACVHLLRAKHAAHTAKVEEAKAAGNELKTLNQAAEISLRLGRPLDGVLADVARVRSMLRAKSDHFAAAAVAAAAAAQPSEPSGAAVAAAAAAAAAAGGVGETANIRRSFMLSIPFSFGVAQILMGHFLQHGTLLSFQGGGTGGDNDEPFRNVTPSEYLIGVMSFTKLVEHYAVGRAIAGDAASIGACRALVEAILEQLLQFDFRNGPLRRNYDGVKCVTACRHDLLFINHNIYPPILLCTHPALL